MRFLCLALFLLTVAPSSRALDSLEEVACICADDAINTGDYVSCVAKFSRRLVAKGVISQGERSDAVSEASSVDLPALEADCEGPSSGDVPAVSGWGVSLETDSPFAVRSPFTGRAPNLRATLRQWNLTPRDAFQVNPNGGDPACQFTVAIVDRLSRVVRRDYVLCGPTFQDFDLPSGQAVAREFEVPLSALNSETGLPDGTALPPGVYRIDAIWSRQGPQAESRPVTDGGLPRATVAIRILD